MDADTFERWRHDHAFLGAKHGTHERRTWAVVALTAVMMVVEIGGGVWSGSLALIADGLHMATHVAALSIAALAYLVARRHADNDWFSFGTGKLGELAAFASALILTMVALLIGWELVTRIIHPVPIAFGEAIPIAVLGLGVNIVSAFLLHDDEHHHGHGHGHGETTTTTMIMITTMPDTMIMRTTRTTISAPPIFTCSPTPSPRCLRSRR